MALCRLKNILLLVFALAINVCAYPEVSIPQGKLRGIEIATRYERTIYGFKGIPFAQPPVGDLRFKAPIAAATWNGTLDATEDADVCPQVDSGSVIGKEDCLYLNVFTPQLASTDSKLLPVMFWIYGGAFSRGTGDSNDVGPNYLLDKDVLLVSPNYRLGPLGFLSTGDEVSPGNYGMKDQVLALQWVQNNIEYFGGDPNRVTIFGLSSGAASVDLLALSDSTTGLFHQSIKHSGSALSPRGYVSRDILAKYSFQLGEYLGCHIATSQGLVDCLRELDAEQIANTTSVFAQWNKYPDIVWRPTDEPVIEGAFLTKSPENLYTTGEVKLLPAISGVTRDEGLYFTSSMYKDPQVFDEFLEKIDTVLPYVLLYHEREDAAAHTAALKSFYFNDMTADKNLLLANLTQLLGDAFYIYPTYSAHKKQYKFGNTLEYFYSFEYVRTFQYPNDSVVPPGVKHADDEAFIFPLNLDWCESTGLNCEFSEADFRMTDFVVNWLTSFAINGTPTNCDTLSNNVFWSLYSTEEEYLRIGNGPELTFEMKISLLRERMDFWDKLTDAESRSE